MITFPFHIGPDPAAVLAWRKLSDGRALCAFFDQPVVQRINRIENVYEYIAGQVIVRLAYERVEIDNIEIGGDAYFLAITDDDDVPEKWRTLLSRDSPESILRAYEHFREGDEDRRRNRTALPGAAPRRRRGER